MTTSTLPSAASVIQTPTDAVHVAMRFLRLLRNHMWIVAACIATSGVIGGAYYLSATRIYEATASLLVESTGSDGWNVNVTGNQAADSLIPTQELLITKSVVLGRAAEELRSAPLELQIDFEDVPFDKWPDVIRQNLTARGFRRTQIIDLAYRSKSPDSAEAILGAVVDSYLAFMAENHKNVSVEMVNNLEKERREIERKLSSKQAQLLETRRRVRVLDVKEGSTLVHPAVQTAIDINTNLVEVQKERIRLQATLASIREAYRTGGDLRKHLIAVDPDVGRHMLIGALGLDQAMQKQANEVERQMNLSQARLERMKRGYGPNNPIIVELQDSINRDQQFLLTYQQKLDERLKLARANKLGPMLLSMLEEDLNKTWKHEIGLREQYKHAESVAVKFGDDVQILAIVEREWKQMNSLFDTLVDRINKIQIKEDATDVRVTPVTGARAKEAPVSPVLVIIAFISIVMGGGAGAVIVYVKDMLDDRFRSPEELRDQLGVQVLAMVRKLSVAAESGLEALQVHQSSSAVESEAFRTLRTALALAKEDLQRVAVTSSEPGDGKTTVLANLAVSYAQAGRRTLVIDCDLRRPGLTKLFDMRRGKGVSQLLRSREEISSAALDFVRETGIEDLHVIPCGPKPSDPAELLANGRLAELIAWAETEYDQVLIDCPPVMAASDAAIVSRLTDGVMLVVQPEKNHRRLVLRSVEHLRAMHVNLLGIVANKVGADKDSGYYGYGYGYGYGENGYGLDDDQDANIADGEDEEEAQDQSGPANPATLEIPQTPHAPQLVSPPGPELYRPAPERVVRSNPAVRRRAA